MTSIALLNSTIVKEIQPVICVENNNKIYFPNQYCNSHSFDKKIVEKCFYSWLKLVRSQRTEKVNEEKLNEFLNGLINEKKTLTCKKISKNKTVNTDDKKSHSTNNLYQRRFIIQKNMIAYQKAKIEEQQRYIEELKLNKIIENITPPDAALKDMKQFLSKCDLSVKPRLKCVVSEVNNDDEDENTLVLNCMKVPKFLQKMEKRARQREEKWAIVKERRKQIELEKERIKEQAILSKQIIDQEEKTRRLNELKEQRRRDQLKAIRAKEFREKMRALTVVADLHYEKKVMAKYGIVRWMDYVKNIKNNYQIAIVYHKKHFIENHLRQWKLNVDTIISRKNCAAQNMYEIKLKKKVFIQLRKDQKSMVSKRQVAEDWYDLRITEQLFVLWNENVNKIKTITTLQQNLAAEHYRKKLLWKIMGLWEMLPKINSIEREREIRKQKWRSKVQEVLPDYIPRYCD